MSASEWSRLNDNHWESPHPYLTKMRKINNFIVLRLVDVDELEGMPQSPLLEHTAYTAWFSGVNYSSPNDASSFRDPNSS